MGSVRHVAVAKPVVTDEWRDAPRLPVDDSPVFTVLLPLMVVLVTLGAVLITAMTEEGRTNAAPLNACKTMQPEVIAKEFSP